MSSDPHVPPKQRSTTPAAPAGPVPGRVVPPPVPAPARDSASTFTRVAAAWWSLAVGLLILIVLLVFIAQNTGTIIIHFLGWHWSSPLGIAFLLAAVGGALVTVTAGTARMVQLRRAAKKNLTAHHRS